MKLLTVNKDDKGADVFQKHVSKETSIAAQLRKALSCYLLLEALGATETVGEVSFKGFDGRTTTIPAREVSKASMFCTRMETFDPGLKQMFDHLLSPSAQNRLRRAIGLSMILSAHSTQLGKTAKVKVKRARGDSDFSITDC